jgi:hypothetical protein
VNWARVVGCYSVVWADGASVPETKVHMLWCNPDARVSQGCHTGHAGATCSDETAKGEDAFLTRRSARLLCDDTLSVCWGTY